MQEDTTMKLNKIVITGGPCAGKTTALSWIENAFTKRGYKVLFVPETATELISGGVAPWTCGTNVDYQKCQVTLQLEKERLFEQAARTMPVDKVLIVCDRGALDNKAYMNQEEWTEVLNVLQKNETELRDGYDAVFHLVTAAKGAVEAYTLANNAARYETVEQAAVMDDKLIAAWTGHPHLRVIDNDRDFEKKMIRLITEIRTFLDEPVPYEIKRKYLIRYPDIAWLESIPNCRKVEISQTYLNSAPGDEIRVRQRGEAGSFIYTKTTKKRVSDVKRIEIEERLTQDEYLSLLMEADPNKRLIRKTRYCLTYKNLYFEIDIYRFWNDQAIMEIELSDENTEIVFPPEIQIIKEVTGDEAFSNISLATI